MMSVDLELINTRVASPEFLKQTGELLDYKTNFRENILAIYLNG